MQNNVFEIDQGEQFGKWLDETSELIYFNCMPIFLAMLPAFETLADYGGANGNLKRFIPKSISIDIDASKKPDIVDNVITHKGNYDVILIRYVLHYLTDKQVKKMLANIKQHHSGKVLIIQFTNQGKDLKIKRQNSINETKYFRTKKQLKKLLKGCNIEKQIEIKYQVTKQFYENRLHNYNATEHGETCIGLLISF